MRSGELARQTGVDVETIRYYEREGLLPPPARQSNQYRVYGPSHVQRLAFIRHCRALDMSLAQTRRLLDFIARPDADCGDINLLIDEQLARVRARLASLQALETQLTVLRTRCQHGQQAAGCGILHELVAAARAEACACHSTAGDAPA